MNMIKEQVKGQVTNEQVMKYEPLVHKIAKQLQGSSNMPYEDLVGFGFEGLLNAFNTYRDNEKQTFIQYAGWQIRYAILNANNNEGNLVKYSYYHQKKDSGMSVKFIDNDDSSLQLEYESGCDVLMVRKQLYKELELNFSARDCDIFYRTYGLKEYDYEKSKDIAQMYNISSASVTIINQKIIAYIKHNENLMDILSELLN